jgi:isopenicillin N synthase-like dioxygenase
MNIPSVDLHQYIHGNISERDHFIQSLGDAFVTVGFVAVTNHGLQSTLIDELYVKTRAFFQLPIDKKLSYEIPSLHGQRGFTSFGKEHAKGSDAPDLKEFFQFGQISDPTGEYPENVTVSDINKFNDIFKEAFKAFEKSGSYLLQAIASYLKLPNNYFDRYIIHGNSILRAIYYPPILIEPKSAIRAEQHEDINLITLLVGASADGLQILSKNGDWLPVVTEPDQIVVNVGDMLQRLTNDTLKSTTHRVVNPPMELWHTPRYSIPFFLHPISSMSLRCLDSCVTTENPRKYDDITAGEYLNERLKEIGLKK